jgi:uncharacterized protein
MQSDDFEWDDEKAAANVAKHGIAFGDAKSVFCDLTCFTREDTGGAYGEQRFIVVGFVGMKLIAVVYTEREGRIRIISARKASGHEQRQYHAG